MEDLICGPIVKDNNVCCLIILGKFEPYKVITEIPLAIGALNTREFLLSSASSHSAV